jgi:ribosomal protein S6
MVFQRLFNDCSENSRYEIVPPAKTIKELESGRFIISDFEVSDEEIPILVRFMRTKQVRLVVHLRWMTMPS